MSKRAFERIAEGLTEVLSIARGEAAPARVHVPEAVDVRAVRAKTGLSQAAFAGMFGFTVHQIRQWEQGRNRPLGAMRGYLMLIEHDPEMVIGAMKRIAGGPREAA